MLQEYIDCFPKIAKATLVVFYLLLQLCTWDIDGWEKKKTKAIQAPPGHSSPLVGETKVQFHNDQSHLLVVHESQIAIYDAQLECLRSVSIYLVLLPIVRS